MLEEKNKGAKMIDFVEHQRDMMDLIKVQCALVQVTTSPQGTQSFDLPPNLTKANGGLTKPGKTLILQWF